MNLTGKSVNLTLYGRKLRLYNQHSADWTLPYPHPVDPNDTLHTAGCGIFSLAHAIEWMSGRPVDPEALARFSLEHGGRGDDGTDRPALLSALRDTGLAESYGFSVPETALQNDRDRLWSHLSEHRGAALANARFGHIVCLIDAHTCQDERQVLVVDSSPSLRNNALNQAIRSNIPGSEVCYLSENENGVPLALVEQHAVYSVPLSLIRDFNLLYGSTSDLNACSSHSAAKPM